MNKISIKWNPKVRKEKIWELYQKEVKGIADEKLIDDVGLALLLRCESILMVSNREVHCPRCKSRFQLKKTWHDKAEKYNCPSSDCDWKVAWTEYHNSWRHRDLIGGGALPVFSEFIEAYPKAKDASSKMVLIDRLIHSFHIQAKSQLPTKTASYNLIEGNMRQVVELLDRLSTSNGTDKEKWRERIEFARRLRRGKAP
jgi:hypothetical protein